MSNKSDKSKAAKSVKSKPAKAAKPPKVNKSVKKLEKRHESLRARADKFLAKSEKCRVEADKIYDKLVNGPTNKSAKPEAAPKPGEVSKMKKRDAITFIWREIETLRSQVRDLQRAA